MFSIDGRHGAQRRDDAADGGRAGASGPTARPSSSTPSLRIDTPGEADYYRNGGILQYVLRQLVAS